MHIQFDINFRLWAGLDCVCISYISSPQQYIERVKITTVNGELFSALFHASNIQVWPDKLSRFLSEPIKVLTAPPEWFCTCPGARDTGFEVKWS